MRIYYGEISLKDLNLLSLPETERDYLNTYIPSLKLEEEKVISNKYTPTYNDQDLLEMEQNTWVLQSGKILHEEIIYSRVGTGERDNYKLWMEEV